MIERPHHVAWVRRLLSEQPVVALLGARQVGKTTLARQVARSYGAGVAFFDLESSRDLAKLADPLLALEPLRGLVVLDEVQRRPDIFPTLRVLADRPRGARFLVLGSASPELLRQTSETLAGRIAFHHLDGLSLREVGSRRASDLWLRGGFPRSFVARTLGTSLRWRHDLVSTYLERDLPQLGIRVPGTTLRRFWTMLAHVHGQILNWSELGRSMAVSDATIRHYVDLLASTFMVRVLPPWHENLSKRQVKAPKIYIREEANRVAETRGAARAVLLLGHPCGRRAGLAGSREGAPEGLRDQTYRFPARDTLHAGGIARPEARFSRCDPRREGHLPARGQNSGSQPLAPGRHRVTAAPQTPVKGSHQVATCLGRGGRI